MIIRLLGIVLLTACAGASWYLRQVVETIPPGSSPSAVGLLVSLVVVVTGIAGGNLLIVGASLFGPFRPD